MARNIRLTIEFDGTGYAGWQTQSGQPTVQGTLARAVEKLTGKALKLTGVGRTDSGVHALDYVANFETSIDIPLKGIKAGLNTLLPEDIVIKGAVEAPKGFDARRDARTKTYLYRVFNSTRRPALERKKCWHVSWPLDVGLMKEGARLLVGKKDFSSFRAAYSDAKDSIREVLSFIVKDCGNGFIEFEVTGTGFLRHMVRIMVGTLVALGRGGCGGKGSLTLDGLSAIIEARDRTRAPETAPGCGLFFKGVEY